MAYTAGDYMVQVRGNLGGSEAFSNTWGVIGTGTVLSDITTITDAFNDFYEDITTFASWLSTEYVATGAQLKDLFTGQVYELSFADWQGSSSGELLPTQLAMRVSLTGAGNVHGGPFLGGFVVAAVDGSLIANSCVLDFKGALETLASNLDAGGCDLGIVRPTVSTVEEALFGRLGHRWDVISRRANDTPESFSSFNVNP